MESTVQDRPNVVRYDGRRFRRNLDAVRTYLPASVGIMQVSKGDGYGLGTRNAVRMGLDAGIRSICVGDASEAWEARKLAGKQEILLFPSTLPAELPKLMAAGITVTVHDRESLDAALGQDGSFYMKVETGLSRFGFNFRNWPDALLRYTSLGRGQCKGVYTHFGKGMADQLEGSLSAFETYLAEARKVIPHPFETMAAASPVLLSKPALGYSRVDPGKLLYGIMADEETDGVATEPVVVGIESRLLQVSDMDSSRRIRIGYADSVQLPANGRLGVFPIGSFDGLSGTAPLGSVIVRGKRLPVLGRTLLHSIVDLTNLSDAQVGDAVVLVGRQGDTQSTLFDYAKDVGTTPIALHFGLVRNLPKQELSDI